MWSKALKMDSNLEDKLRRFMTAFELVFDNDWEFTESAINGDMCMWMIAADGTFLRPKVLDESNNWCNRGNLLKAYRELVVEMKTQGIYGFDFWPDTDSEAG